MRFLIPFLVYSIAPFILFAQTKKDSIYLDLDQIEISAQAKPSSSLSTTPLQVLTEKDFTNQGLQSVSDAVKRFNGVVLKDYGGIGGLKTVSIRGMGAEYTAIGYDGVVASSGQSGQVDIGRFTLDNISMLSLSIGQDDNIYQSAKSFASAGILNLQTKRPTLENKNYQLYTKVSTGSFGYLEPSINYDQKISRKTIISANVNWQRADGKYPFKLEEDPELTNRKRRNSDTDILRTEINIYNKLTDKDNLDVKIYYFDSKRGLPGSVILHNEKTDNNERLWDKNTFTQITYNRIFNDRWKFKSLIKYDYNHQKYKTEPYTSGGERQAQYNRYNLHEVYWSNSGHYQIQQNLSLVLSQDLAYNSLRSSFSSQFNNSRSEPDRYSSYTALAAQYRAERFTVTASGLYSYIHEKITNKENVTHKFDKLSPAIGASVKPFTNVNMRLRTSYKHIFRIPTFSELYYLPIDRNLDPESSTQYNVGVTWVGQIKNTPIQYINVSVDGYYNNVRNKIIVIPTPFLPSVLNQGKVEMKGIDTKLNTAIDINSDIDINILGVYSYIKAYDADRKSDSYKGQLPYTPVHSGSITLTLNNPWINLSYSILASGIRYSNTENRADSKINAYTDHSLSANKEILIRNNKLYTSANLLNLLNKNYDIIAYYAMPGRSFRITIGFKL